MKNIIILVILFSLGCDKSKITQPINEWTIDAQRDTLIANGMDTTLLVIKLPPKTESDKRTVTLLSNEPIFDGDRSTTVICTEVRDSATEEPDIIGYVVITSTENVVNVNIAASLNTLTKEIHIAQVLVDTLPKEKIYPKSIRTTSNRLFIKIGESNTILTTTFSGEPNESFSNLNMDIKVIDEESNERGYFLNKNTTLDSGFAIINTFIMGYDTLGLDTCCENHLRVVTSTLGKDQITLTDTSKLILSRW